MRPMLALFGSGPDWLPVGSDLAGQVDGVIRGLLIAGTAVVVILGVTSTFILIRYRRGSGASRARVRTATWKIETAWTVVTLGVFLYFFWRGTAVYLDMERVPAGAEVVHVVARQWMWDMRYGDGRREFNELHLRLGTPVRLVLSSEDVIHSFFVPAFRMKQDVVPGKVVSAWVNPTRAGTYTLFCAQYCGTAHAEMIGKIVVLDAGDFDAWKKGGPGSGAATAALGSVGRGRGLYSRFGCARCHDSASGTSAPSLVGLYGSQVRLKGGGVVQADEQYLHDAILLAPKTVVAGYAPAMPTYAGLISEPDALDLISYIESLKPKGAPLAFAQ
jgi:cytochrome c oxidase subunit II